MPAFRCELPAEKEHMGFSLVRVPETGAIKAIITCEELCVCDTHYWGGRTVPCERLVSQPDGSLTAGDCPACNSAIPFRSHCYVSAFDVSSRKHFIFESTAAAAFPFEEYYKTLHTVRGCAFHAVRPKGGRNGKVQISTNTANLSRVQLPAGPDIVRILCMIWRIPLKNEKQTENGLRTQSLHIDDFPNRRMNGSQDSESGVQSIADVLSLHGKAAEAGYRFGK